LTQKGLCLALELGPHTYVGEHQLICRKGESANVKRVGLDNRSADQKIMTDVFFGGSDVERVDLSYHESLQRIVKGDVDAVIWNVVAENELTMLGLEATPLTDDPRFLQATEAVVLTRVDDYPMQQLLRAVVDKHALLAHQQRVVSGEQEPSY
ncbi:YhfZ family protein, partial [Escherichia coli]